MNQSVQEAGATTKERKKFSTFDQNSRKKRGGEGEREGERVEVGEGARETKKPTKATEGAARWSTNKIPDNGMEKKHVELIFL
jgi:hypothetical protein